MSFKVFTFISHSASAEVCFSPSVKIASFTKNVYVDLANEYADLVIKLARVKYYFDYTPSQRWAMKCQM